MRWAILGMVGFALVLASWLVRYELVPAGEVGRALPVVYILDRWTGQIDRCWGSANLSGCDRDVLREKEAKTVSLAEDPLARLRREEGKTDDFQALFLKNLALVREAAKRLKEEERGRRLE